MVWYLLKDGIVGRTIDPILYRVESEEFTVKITDKEPERVEDDNGVVDLWEWQAAQMENDMVYLIDYYGFKPKHYCSPREPMNPVCILPHHVYHLHGVKMAYQWPLATRNNIDSRNDSQLAL